MASLCHTYDVTGASMRITFTGVTVEAKQSSLGLPALKLPSPLDAVGPNTHFPPRHQTWLDPSFLESLGESWWSHGVNCLSGPRTAGRGGA